jgi:hypothetical protein
VEKLDAADKKGFESGIMPKKLLTAVRAAWSSELKTHLPIVEQVAVIREVLPNPRDYDTLMNCPWGQLETVPKRIHTVVAKALKKRACQIHTAFFDNEGEARLADYLRVWRSQERALSKLINQATGMKADEEGNLDPEQYYLDMVAAKGTAASIGGLRYFLGGVMPVILKKGAGLVYDETLEPGIVLLPDKDGLWASETRLNSFLKKLGRALESTKKRGAPLWEPDWLHNVDQTLRYIVYGWRESITVDGERWPPLCFLTTPALVQFLRKCNVTHCKLAKKDARTIEKEIQRLGLVGIPRGRIKHVQKRGGKFYFT